MPSPVLTVHINQLIVSNSEHASDCDGEPGLLKAL